MNRTLFRQIHHNSRLLAVGNYFRSSAPEGQWRLAAHFDCNGELRQQHFPLEMSCVLAIGRKYPGEAEAPYTSSGFRSAVKLPAMDAWQEQPLGACPRLAKKLAAHVEIHGQQCYVFDTGDGQTVWLPKFELARKLFFHAAFLVRAAFQPNGLDMVFTIYKEPDGVHVHTPAKTGAPSQLLKIAGYRDFFSWLLLDSEVRQSFESIWQHLNREQVASGSRYIRWKFNFMPPASLAGATLLVRGPYDPDRNELLVWEIESIQGLQLPGVGEVYFHHPALKSPTGGKSAGCIPTPAPAGGIAVDAEQEPTAAKEQRLIHLPVESVGFVGELNTRIAYKDGRSGAYGRKEDQAEPQSNENILGVADPVSDGTIAPGEFEQLGEGCEVAEAKKGFELLRQVIEEIIQESDIELLSLNTKPLPMVPRCRGYMMEDGRPRYYLLARFRLPNGSERYLLEIDTSDNRKRLSTRVLEFDAGVDAQKAIAGIQRSTVKSSLRWPRTMAKCCARLHSVHHPKEMEVGVDLPKIRSWKQRLYHALSR